MIENHLNDDANIKLFEYWSQFAQNLDAWNTTSEIHSIDHWLRVMLLGLMICESAPQHTRFAEQVCIAAAFHDTRRHYDGIDKEHGQRGADFYREYCENNRNIEYFPAVEFAIRWHDCSDEKAANALMSYSQEDTDEIWHLYQIFKDADGLDRVRLGDLDETRLRLDVSRELVATAWQLLGEIEL